jgi:galactose mutarotase-like enzyme
MTRESIAVAQDENVLIRAGECNVTALPQFGGKIASIRIGTRELLQTPLAPIAPRAPAMAFDEGDASGWDECLPSVAACQVETEAGPAEIPDHGDLWRVEWERQESGIREQGSEDEGKNGPSVTLVGKCFSLPLEMERRLELSETESGWRLDFGYSLTNTGEFPVPWSWAAHPLFAVEPGDRIALPPSICSLRLEGSGGGRLGKSGDTVSWPLATHADGSTVDLSIAEAADSGIGDKLFAGPLERSENWCALQRVSAGVCIRTTFDTVATPYLGLWICYGGWPERPGQKQVCVALEPSTAPVDSLAITGPWSRVLAPGASSSWRMQIEIERIER